MTKFEVWAPKPKQVALHLRDHDLPMVLGQRGWWSVDAEAAAGDDYGFVLDGGRPLPDPSQGVA